MIVDLVLFYAIVKSGRHRWKHPPLVRHILGWIIFGGCELCLWPYLAVTATVIPLIGQRVVFFTTWLMQSIVNIGSVT